MKEKTKRGEFAHYASLNMLGMLGISCYILADTFFISLGMGPKGLAALNLAIPMYNLIHGISLMLGMGGGIRYSVCRGRGDRQAGEGAFSQMLLCAMGLGLFFALSGFFLAGPFVQMMGAEGKVLAMSTIYLRVLMAMAPAFMINDVLTCFVRNDGEPRRAMAAMLGGSFVNILLDYVFIFLFDWGIFGAALATGVAPLVGILILLPHWLGREKGVRFSLSQGRKAPFFQMVLLGVPSFVGEISNGVVIGVFNAILLSLCGDVGVAAYGVVANLSLVAVAVLTGLAQGMQPILSGAWGRGEKETACKALGQGLRWGIVTALLIEGVLTLWAEPVTALFNSSGDPQLQQMGVQGLRLYFTAMLFVGINMVAVSYFAATEQPLPAHSLSLLRGILLIVPMAFLLAHFLGVIGVWLAFPLTEAIVALGSALLLLRERVRLRRKNTP